CGSHRQNRRRTQRGSRAEYRGDQETLDVDFRQNRRIQARDFEPGRGRQRRTRTAKAPPRRRVYTDPSRRIAPVLLGYDETLTPAPILFHLPAEEGRNHKKHSAAKPTKRFSHGLNEFNEWRVQRLFIAPIR